MIKVGKGAKRPRTDYHLTRHACYLIVENADPEKPVVALGQAYFAYQIRQTIQELGGTMPEDLPTPEKSIQQLRREEQERLERGPQLSLFEPDKNETDLQ